MLAYIVEVIFWTILFYSIFIWTKWIIGKCIITKMEFKDIYRKMKIDV